jgi:hypothetical protein
MAMIRSFPEEWRRTAGWLLLICAGLALSGCKVAHMALPQGSQGASTELAVEGRHLLIVRNSFDFEPYQVTDIHRGWTKGKGWSISSGSSEFSSSKAKQKYEFSVSESGRAAWGVQCATGAGWSEVETKGFLGGGFGIEFASTRQLACALKQEGGEKLAKLVMAQSASETVMEGVMTDGATKIDISVTYKVDTSPLKLGDPTGYIFHMDGRFVGAVEVINKGTVWIHNAVPPETRSALAATSAVLLMYQDVGKMS